MDRWATFDCYGTLVDWNAGLAGALGGEALLARYHEVEPVVQAESPGLSYREVLRESARRLGVDADPAETLPGWPVFDDVRPELEAARVRAMFVRADWTRRGLGRRILEACEDAAAAEGFIRLSLMATLPGVPLYRAYGFEPVEDVLVTLPNGVTLESMTMEKGVARPG